MPRIIGMLSFFDEDPSLLRESVSRAMKIGIDHLLAYDGPYDLRPHAVQKSPADCYTAIHDAVYGGGIPANTGRSWDWRDKGDWGAGNEVEKRNAMLEHALRIAEEGDWLLVFDSDHMWEKTYEWIDLGHILGLTPRDDVVAEVAFADCAIDEIDPSWYEACLLYRAVPGMRYEGAHWRIRFLDGTVSTTLRTEQERHTAPTLDLRDFFRVRHIVYQAGEERRARQTSWYEQRDGLGLEK